MIVVFPDHIRLLFLSDIADPPEFSSDVETRKSHMELNLVKKVGAVGLSSLSSPKTRVLL